MAEKLRVTALDAFVDQLNELYDQAGSPTLAELRRLSKRHVASVSRELAESTTHDILSGKRKKVPEWPWVQSFIVVCAMAARRTGLDVGALADPQAWHQRWRDARTELPTEPDPDLTTTPVRPAPNAASSSLPPVLTTMPLPPVLTAAASPVPPMPNQRSFSRVTLPAPLPPPSPSTQRLLEVYGRIGTRLVNRSDAGNGHDCMRLAGDAGLCEAPELFNHPNRREAAAELAFRYGCDAEPGQANIAQFFYRLAAESGHAEAAARLAAARRSQGDDWAPEPWLSGPTPYSQP
jgi:hypothetical protein